MGQHYILDGYNVLHSIPELETLLDKNLEEARNKLEELTEFYCRSGEITVTIVYDSRSIPNLFDDYQDGSQPFIVFTGSSKTADDFIILEAEKHKTVSTTIVSRDNRIISAARRSGCSVISPRTFYNLAKKKKGRSGTQPKKYRDKPLGQDEIDKWLQYFQDNDK